MVFTWASPDSTFVWLGFFFNIIYAKASPTEPSWTVRVNHLPRLLKPGLDFWGYNPRRNAIKVSFAKRGEFTRA